MTIERTACIIQRPVFGAHVQVPVSKIAGPQQQMALQPVPFFDNTHNFRPVAGEDYMYYCVYCLGRTTEVAYRAIIDGEVNTIQLAKSQNPS